MTELEALRRVAEAVRQWKRACDGGTIDDRIASASEVWMRVAALDALPPEAPGEMAEYAVWLGNTGVLTICVVGSDADSNWLQGEKRIGTVRLPLVVATVEPAP